MNKGSFLFALVVFSATACAFDAPENWFSHSFELHAGEEVEVGNYSIEYSLSSGGATYREFLSVKKAPFYGLIMRFGDGADETPFSEAYGNTYLVEEGAQVAIRLNRRSTDAQGKFMDFTVFAEENLFASSNLSTTIKRIIAHPGDEIKLSLKLENLGFKDEEYVFSSQVPFDWKTHFTYLGFEVPNVPLSAGESGTVTLEIKVPRDAATGNYSLTVHAKDLSESSLSLEFLVDATAESEFSTSTTKISTDPGEKISLDLELENTGYMTEVYQLSAELPRRWDISFDYLRLETSEVQLDGQQKATIATTITVPYNAEFGKYVINVTAEDISKTTLPIEITVKGESEMELSLSKVYMKTEAGTDNTITAKVYNRGTAAIHNAELTVELPSSDWSYLSDPLSIERVAGGEFAEFEVTFSVPPTESTGDKFVSISATSDEKTTQETELRVNITTSNQGVYVGLFILLLAGGVLYWVIKKQGRR